MCSFILSLLIHIATFTAKLWNAMYIYMAFYNFAVNVANFSLQGNETQKDRSDSKQEGRQPTRRAEARQLNI